MLILRFTQTTEGQDKYHIEIAFEGDGLPRQIATARFDFKLTSQDQEDLRWYLEDFLQYPQDPAPKIAKRIEKRITEIGVQLFKALFQSSDDARDMWATLRDHLNDIRVEIVTDVQGATSIPWELVRDPKTDTPLALRARSFVRTHPQAAQRPQIPKNDGHIRILLVICRPGGEEDVPFRSVASRLIKGLGEDARAAFQLDVLRPPTFEQLGLVLRAAKTEGQPYHVVHFDGHGTYIDTVKSGELPALLTTLSPVVLSGSRSGAHGYLLFENPVMKENMQLVDGTSLGKLLVETGVPVLVLNACRSAHAEPQSEPVSGETRGDESHARVRALGSLAQEVMEAGASGVVAMRYNVYVITAARFVRDLYGSLIQGNALGEAVTMGRKQLSIDPMREIAYKPIPLQDWSVPVVYEAAPIVLFPKQAKPEKLTITLSEGQATPSQRGLDPNLPKSPDAGFFGRDETLLALDRAFDTQSIVLLHAYAGNGKTATTAEFARWYVLTGGIQGGAVIFTSFEQYKPLARVLDQVGGVFEKALEQAGIHWLALDDKSRRDVALQVIKQIPVLWIWDNVEPVAGFPIGTKSAWSEAEKKELVGFLRDARGTKAKFLLTSRRDEQEWLGDLPRRINVPPMPMQERVQLARALAEKHGRRLTEVEDWRPLLDFTQGNPLTITVLVGQALRDGLKTKDQVDSFVSHLRAGEAVFQDEVSQGRAKSLGASLSYGFEHTFTEEEQKKLALLYFFHGFVNVDVLKFMGDPEDEWCLPEVRGLSREDGMKLLDRASEIGLLTAYGEGYYSIHPALPWFFKSMLDRYYSPSRQETAARAFVEAMGEMTDSCVRQYHEGNRDFIAVLAAEEANLLQARNLALINKWLHGVISAMDGLRWFYEQMGFKAKWERLVDELIPDFVDPVTGGPLPGREKEWESVTLYRAHIARKSRNWSEAERLLGALVERNRKDAADAIDLSPEKLDHVHRNNIASLASSIGDFAELLSEMGRPECVAMFEEELMLKERIGSLVGASICALNLGNAYKNISYIRDLAKAEIWYRQSLKLTDENDMLGRAKCFNQLGYVAYERFKEAISMGASGEELLIHFNAASKSYHRALDMLPKNAVSDLAVTHNQLGILYMYEDVDRSLHHYRHSIRYEEMQGNMYGAAMTRVNVAFALLYAGRLQDALEYADSALHNYETFGDRAANKIKETREFIVRIQERKKKGGKA